MLKLTYAFMAAVALVALNDARAAPPASAGQGDAKRQVEPARNPGPRTGYKITFRFSGLPGPLTEIFAFAQFEVGNLDCIPVDYTRAPGGIRLPPEFRLDLTLQRQEDGSYVTSVYEDALLDADLFGLGTCRWRMDSVTANFKSEKTLFVGGTSTANLRASTAAVQHYLEKDFREKPKLADWVFGEKPDHYLKSLGPQFTLTTTSRPVP